MPRTRFEDRTVLDREIVADVRAVRTSITMAVTAAVAAALLGGIAAAAGERPDYETREVRVRAGGNEKTLTLADLRALPPVTVENYQPIGTSKGPLSRSTWTGASLKDVLLSVDPRFCERAAASPAVTVRSQDGWTVTLKWPEVCGAASGGEALYNVKGCNECHGVEGEGSAPPGKTPAPALRDRGLTPRKVAPLLRQGGKTHTKFDVYTERRLPDPDLADILSWLNGSDAAASRYVVPRERRAILLAYGRNGQTMTGRDGLIQLIVAMDEIASRYSHWVDTITVEE